MKNIIYIMLLLPLVTFSQKKDQKKAKVVVTPEEKNLVRDGNDLYKQNRFVDAEVKYKKALEKNPDYEIANFNLGNAIYEQNRFKEASPFYEAISKTSKDEKIKAEAFHNTGNINMKQKQYAQAIEAYKNSLRLNPKDEETRYNLALAKKLLQQQKDKNKKDKNKKDKNKKDKDNKDKNKKDKQNKDKQNKDQKDKSDQNKDQKDKNNNQDKNKQDKNQQNKNKQDKQQQPKPNELSKQQMKQLLEAMNNEENKTQKKVNAKKARGRKIKQEKDW